MTDRALTVRAVDIALQVAHKLDMLARGLRLELDGFGDRIKVLERGAPPPVRPPLASGSDWNLVLAEAGAELSKRVRDPRDHLDSNRARAIAQEVYKTARDAEDAESMRGLRTRRWTVRDQIIAAVIAGFLLAVSSAVATHFAWR
jgi:hypothetical protein